MMQDVQNVLRFFADGLGESFGWPVGVRRFVERTPGLRVSLDKPAQVVAAGSTVEWHHWHPTSFHRGKGVLQYWRPDGYGYHGYGSYEVHRPELEHFVRHTVIENWSCDIQDVVGVANSKSKIETFATLDAMVVANSPSMISPVSDAKLRENLAHDEIRILRAEGKSDYFTRYMWDDGRVFLMNSGGSHHFAAARYIAARLGRAVPLSGTLYTYAVRPDAVTSLLRDFDLYAMPSTGVYIGFLDAMRTFGAPFGIYGLPKPYDDRACMILLPREHPRSMRVSAALREAGIADAGQLLLCTLGLQRSV